MIKKKVFYTIYHVLFLTFCFIIPFEESAEAVPNILIGLIAFAWFFVIKKSEILGTIKSKGFIAFSAFLLFIILHSIFNNHFFEDLYIIRKAAIPLAVILLASPIKNTQTIKYVFVFSTLLAVMWSLFNIFNYINLHEEFKFSRGTMVNELLVSERLYIGFCSVISLIFSIEIFRKNKQKKTQVIAAIVCVILVVFVFLIAARIAIISILWVLILYIFTQLSFKNKIIASTSLIFFIVAFFLINPNLTKRFFRADDLYQKTFFDKIAMHEPRFVIWTCSIKIIKENPNLVFGNGFKNIQNQLINCYQKDIELDHKREWFVDSKFNSHNQYLDLIMSSGIVGLLLFSLFSFYIYKHSNQDFYALAIISSLLLILSVENILHRQIGNYLLALIFITTQIKPEKNIK